MLDINSKDVSKTKKVDYKTWKGNNQFFCGGKFITGPKSEAIPSIIMHSIILTVLTLWTIFAIPSLICEKNG